MTEEYIKSIIKETLNIPVFLGAESITYPAATLESRINTPELFGDGVTERRLVTAYINLWYEDRSDRDAAVNKLIAAFDFRTDIIAPDIETYYDTTAKKFRAVLTIQYVYAGSDRYLYKSGHLYQDSLNKKYEFTYNAPEGDLQYSSLGGTDVFSLQDGSLYVSESVTT